MGRERGFGIGRVRPETDTRDVSRRPRGSPKSEICGWPVDICRVTQERRACTAGNGRCELLVTAEKPERSE